MFNFLGRLTGIWLAIVIFINLAIVLAVFIIVSKIARVFLGVIAIFFLAMAINESIRIVSVKYKWNIPVIPTIFGMKVWMGGFIGTLAIAILVGFLGDDLVNSLKELSSSVRGELSISSLSQADLGRVYKVKKGTPYYTTNESGEQIIKKTEKDIEVIDQGERKKVGMQHLVIVTLPNEEDGWNLTGKVASFLATDLKSYEPADHQSPPPTTTEKEVPNSSFDETVERGRELNRLGIPISPVW